MYPGNFANQLNQSTMYYYDSCKSAVGKLCGRMVIYYQCMCVCYRLVLFYSTLDVCVCVCACVQIECRKILTYDNINILIEIHHVAYYYCG